MSWLTDINWEQIYEALVETIYMTGVSMIFIVVFGLLIGILLYCTQTGGLYENKYISKVVDVTVNVLRAIPFIIMVFLIIPFTKLLCGTMLGATAAIPSLVFTASPFFARLCVIAFNEVDKGTIEASEAMGASKFEIITKVLLPEALPAIVSGISVTAVTLVGYTAMSGAIGAGGLGNVAYLYGFSRRNGTVLYLATAMVVLIVFILQGIGDYLVSKIDKR